MNGSVLTIVAGSNGCGKSTLTAGAREKFQGIPVLDPDAIAKSLQEERAEGLSEIEAGRQVLRLAAELIGAKQSFTVETTLAGNTYLKMALRAKARGFKVVLIFIGTNSLEINLVRVRERVAKGGHDVPEIDQRRRYPRTLANLPRFLAMADLALLFDNSTEAGHKLVSVGTAKAMTWIEPVPTWAVGVRQES